jgi:hypothetical protein
MASSYGLYGPLLEPPDSPEIPMQNVHDSGNYREHPGCWPHSLLIGQRLRWIKPIRAC